jgi:hypothetical protein
MMRLSFRPSLIAVAIIVGAFGFTIWSSAQRASQVATVSNVDAKTAVVDPRSPSGYADGKRWLIIPEHNNASYQWITETQQMLARGDFQVPRIDYENAPFGREVYTSSLYHGWLALVARIHSAWSGVPLSVSVERGALWAGPALHLLMLLVVAMAAWRWFNSGIAAALAAGLATLFPGASCFLPGVPDEQGLTLALAIASVLPLLIGVSRPKGNSATRWFFFGGLFGGFGLWNNASSELPLLAGIGLGGLLACWIAHRPDTQSAQNPTISPLLWRIWALGGAATCLVGYIIQGSLHRPGIHLQVNHPVHGIAWLGMGEIVTLAWGYRVGSKGRFTRRHGITLGCALIALGALPVAIAMTGTGNPFAGDPISSRLSHLEDSTSAKNLATWVGRDGLSVTFLATCLPVLLLLPLAWPVFLRSTESRQRVALAITLGPVAVSLAAACSYLRWWNIFDACLLTLIAASVPALTPRLRGLAWSIGGLALACGLFVLVPSRRGQNRDSFTPLEVQGLIERALAHWITDHAGPGRAIVVSPPDLTSSLTFYGGFRGLGTPNWENSDAVAATTRIFSATTGDEAQALLAERGVTHIVLPSWDPELDEFVRWTLSRPEDSFLNALHKWAYPNWLRPVPYPLPVIAGFEQQSVMVLEVTDNTDRATSLCWIVEAALELHQGALAAAASTALEAYPANLSALVARAMVEKSRGNDEAFAALLTTIESNLTTGLDRRMPWDRRVGLAIVLAQGDRAELARHQLERCIREVDTGKLKSLTTGSLYRMQVLAKTLHLSLPGPTVRELGLTLLPAELRERL